ncbi:MAG: hypothetical protein HY823_01980 [Acidobacteria bacterium]|nr:hypothetical protein [Acidobacteriota bacterium]
MNPGDPTRRSLDPAVAPTALERFTCSLEASEPDFRESLDLEALQQTAGTDRSEAEAILLRRAAEEDDWRVPPAIASIGLHRAIPVMEERLPQARGRMRLALARSLVSLGALRRMDETVAAMLEDGDREEGISALAASEGLSSPEVLAALARACTHHPSPEVRVNAGAHLFCACGETRDPLAWEFRPLYLQLGDPDEARRQEAFQTVCNTLRLPQDLLVQQGGIPDRNSKQPDHRETEKGSEDEKPESC